MPRVVTPTLDDDYDEDTLNRAIPSWVISLALHGLVFGALFVGANRYGTPDGNKNQGGVFIDGGFVGNDKFGKGDGTALGDQQAAGGSEAVGALEATATPILIAKTAQPDDAGISKVLQLPSTPSNNGASNLPPDIPRSGTLRPSPRPGAAGGLRIGKGTGTGNSIGAGPGSGFGTGAGGKGNSPFGSSDGTSFFQITAQGDQFCYVVDCSGSMEGKAMGLARAELMASVERLDSTKRFQILFYNAEIHPLTNGKTDSFYATEINRTFARQFIANQQPELSTLHKPPLAMALRRAPDVIFFLTDGEEPKLDASDLKDLKRLNRGNTKIHVVQFGQGAKLSRNNWLETLATEHNGTYRYRDTDASVNIP